jgi:MoxR-like ATPase
MKDQLQKKLKVLENGDSQITEFFNQANSVIYGKEQEMRLALCTFLAGGHLLVEDMPGVGKTTFVTCLAQLLGLRLSRIQFTNDLLPSDIIGAAIFSEEDRKFHFHQGPIFGEVVLGDELNRANPKTQSAFLQAMEEHRVTVDGISHELPAPFFVVATQNPQTQVGTYALPESQLDRFMMRLSLGYPNSEAETKMLSDGNPRLRIPLLKPIFSRDEFSELQQRSQHTKVSLPLIKYVQSILAHSRAAQSGLSPRAGILILQAARSWAFLEGRDMVLPEDIQALAPHMFEHRMPPQSNMSIESLLKSVSVP